MNAPAVEGSARGGFATLGLLLVSVIWGTTFVAVKSAMHEVSPLLFVGLRFALAAVAALPLVWRARRDRRAPGPLGRGGLLLGVVLAVSYATQTIGLTTTTPTRSAFVTALNVVLIPFWAFVLHRQKPGWFPVMGLIMTLPGLYLLTSPQGGAWNRGDSWTLVCALTYALYVVLLARLAKDHPRMEDLLFFQLAVTSTLSLAASSALETPRISLSPGVVLALLSTSVFATTGAIWLQLRCQPRVKAARAALIYATEPVFAAFFAWLFLGETLKIAGQAGAGLILGGMVLSELGAQAAVAHRTRKNRPPCADP